MANRIVLNIVLVKDPNVGGFSAFCRQFPDIVGEGVDEETATNSLMSIVQGVLNLNSEVLRQSSWIKLYEKTIVFTAKRN